MARTLRRAGHRPVPDRAHVPRRASASRSSAARSSSPWPPRARRRRPPPAATLDDDEAEAVAHLRRRDGQARGPPAGRLRGHLPGDGRAAGGHPADRPAAPRVPAEPRGAAGQGHPGRGDGGATEEDTELLATIKSLHEQNPMLGLRGCRLGPDDPGLREGPDPGDPQRAHRASSASGGHPKAKIMIPLVGHVNELKATKDLLEAEAKAVEAAAGTSRSSTCSGR